MVDLVLNRRLSTRNILLAQETSGEHVGYLLPNGGHRFVPWLGFIERAKARAMKAGRSVRLGGRPRIRYSATSCFCGRTLANVDCSRRNILAHDRPGRTPRYSFLHR